MASIGTTEVIALQGDLPSVLVPIKATQSGTSTIIPGDPVNFSSGQIQRCTTNGGSNITSSTGIFGIADFNSVKTVSGVATALAANTLVKVIPLTRNVVLDLPTVGATPAIASHLASGAVTAGFQLAMSSTGQLQCDLANTATPVVRPFSVNLMDWRSNAGAPTLKTTGVVGDRFTCAVLAAAKQVDI